MLRATRSRLLKAQFLILNRKKLIDRLKRWAISRLSKDGQLTIVSRFRSRSDADGHLRLLQHRYPNETFVVIVDQESAPSH
jgi:hypothetical protein